MNFKFWSKPPERKSATRDFFVPINQGSWLEEVISGSGNISAYKAMKLYESCAAIATSVDIIAESIEGIVPVIKTKDGEYITDHELLTLLDQPNGFQSYSSFIGDVVRNWLLKHDTHIVAYGNVKTIPLQLYSVKPFNVSTMENPADCYPESYSIYSGVGSGQYNRIEKGKGVVRFTDRMGFKEMCHIMGYTSRTSNVEALSPLSSAALEAKQLIKGKYHNLKLLDNGGRLSLIVAFSGETPTDDEYQLRKDRIKESLTGENAGGIAVVSAEDVKIEEVGKSNKDMDFANLEGIAERTVYKKYRIPLPIVTTDASTFNNYDRALEALYDDAVLPTLKKINEGLTKFLMPRMGASPTDMWFDYNPEDIAVLRTRRLAELKIRKDVGVETINEMRQDIPNRDSVIGGDVIYVSSTLVPLGTDPFSDDSKTKTV